MTDPYKTLRVSNRHGKPRSQAFRALAKKHHPDAHPGDESCQRFQELSAAYDVVGDKDKRAKFDAGEIDASGNPRGFDPRAYAQQGGFRASPFGGARPFRSRRRATFILVVGGEEAQGFSAEDIFSEILGGGIGARRAMRAGSRVARARISSLPSPSVCESVQGGTRRGILQNWRTDRRSTSPACTGRP